MRTVAERRPPVTKKRRSSSIRAEAAFRAKLAELGAVLLEDEWLGASTRHRVRCPTGHDCAPIPTQVTTMGIGICARCAGSGGTSTQAEAKFRARLDELGAVLLESRWLGAKTPHRVRCAAGHLCTPRPNSVVQGNGACLTCAGKNPVVEEAAFRQRMADLGAVLLETGWRGSNARYRALCPGGHECYAVPSNIKSGLGFCRACGRQRIMSRAESEFRARLEAVGAVMLEPKWLGTNYPHRIRCARGHEVSPCPGGVQQGQGVCRKCKGMYWDVFYVVVNNRGVVKFGITSGDHRKRLSVHRHAGFTETVRLWTDLPGKLALDTETSTKRVLALAGIEPLPGKKEYFPPEALAVVLDVADGYLPPP